MHSNTAARALDMEVILCSSECSANRSVIFHALTRCPGRVLATCSGSKQLCSSQKHQYFKLTWSPWDTLLLSRMGNTPGTPHVHEHKCAYSQFLFGAAVMSSLKSHTSTVKSSGLSCFQLCFSIICDKGRKETDRNCPLKPQRKTEKKHRKWLQTYLLLMRLARTLQSLAAVLSFIF